MSDKQEMSRMVSVPDLDIDSPAGNLAIRLICRSAVRHAEISVLFLVCLVPEACVSCELR
jgi:hypothetical protein